jgi:hypothetical protein
MEFLSQTYLETTTQLIVNSSTITQENIMNPDIRQQYISDSLNSDATTASITISFDATQSVDRISIMEFNAKKFNVYYNGVTANAFSLTNPTTTSQWTNNSATNLYISATPVNCTSVTFDFYSTQVANSEKAIGYIYVGANELTFPRVPNASSYTPVRDPKELINELSDGGTRRHLVQTKWATKVKFQYITESFRDSLKTIFDTMSPKVFVPFGTGTAWDGILFESNWIGNFDFYKYSDDATQSGFSGSIDLKET